MHFEAWHRLEATARLWHEKWGHKVVGVLRWVVPAILISWLVWSLARLGWGQVWNGRPRGLLFYGALLLPFYVQPLADLVIYRFLLREGGHLPMQVMLRKRYVNSLLDYSGEVYFFFWARRNLTLPKGRLMHAVKDTNVLSASAGLVTVWLTLLAVLLSGSIKLPASLQSGIWGFLALGSLPLVLAAALFAGGRKVTKLKRPEMLAIFGGHLARALTQLGVEFVIWLLSGALPSAAICLQFVALHVVVTRLPLIPNKDLLFMGIGIAAAGVMDVSAPKVAAVLVLLTAAGLLQNLLVVGLPWLFEQFQLRRRISVA